MQHLKLQELACEGDGQDWSSQLARRSVLAFVAWWRSCAAARPSLGGPALQTPANSGPALQLTVQQERAGGVQGAIMDPLQRIGSLQTRTVEVRKRCEVQAFTAEALLTLQSERSLTKRC